MMISVVMMSVDVQILQKARAHLHMHIRTDTQTYQTRHKIWLDIPHANATQVDVMYAGNLAKFQQNAKLREALLSTKGTIKGHGFRFWVGICRKGCICICAYMAHIHVSVYARVC